MTNDPVESFLERYGKPVDAVTIFENGGNAVANISDTEAIYSPNENVTYSVASGDYNPIHTNSFVADLSGKFNEDSKKFLCWREISIWISIERSSRQNEENPVFEFSK